jgi:hypothetical protein
MFALQDRIFDFQRINILISIILKITKKNYHHDEKLKIISVMEQKFTIRN